MKRIKPQFETLSPQRVYLLRGKVYSSPEMQQSAAKPASSFADQISRPGGSP